MSAGFAVVDLDSVVWVPALMPDTSDCKAELTALPQVLELAEETIANIYTDCRYVFAMAGNHGPYIKREDCYC